jgi:hypothetical protein
MSSNTKYAWHFLYEGNKLRGGQIAPPDGEWLIYDGQIEICNSGLHFSYHPFDALNYAPGPILCLVEVDDVIESHHDKAVCSKRKIIKRMDATEMLRYFARMQALKVIHLWDDPPDVVLDYLMTGDESIRNATRNAARGAAWGAAWNAAKNAAGDTAWGAAWGASRGAAWDTAWAAASDAAMAVGIDAALEVARSEFQALVYECFDVTDEFF